MLTLAVRDLEVRCVIGCNPDERRRLQPVSLDFQLRFDGREAAEADEPALTWDYTELAARARFILVEGRFQLIEAAAQAALQALLTPPIPGDLRPELRAGELRLTKPGAFPGSAKAQVTLRLDAPRLAPEPQPWGTLWRLQGEGRAHLSLLQLRADQAAPLEPLGGHRLSALPLGPGLALDGASLAALATARVTAPASLKADADSAALLLHAPE